MAKPPTIPSLTLSGKIPRKPPIQRGAPMVSPRGVSPRVGELPLGLHESLAQLSFFLGIWKGNCTSFAGKDVMFRQEVEFKAVPGQPILQYSLCFRSGEKGETTEFLETGMISLEEDDKSMVAMRIARQGGDCKEVLHGRLSEVGPGSLALSLDRSSVEGEVAPLDIKARRYATSAEGMLQVELFLNIAGAGIQRSKLERVQ